MGLLALNLNIRFNKTKEQQTYELKNKLKGETSTYL